MKVRTLVSRFVASLTQAHSIPTKQRFTTGEMGFRVSLHSTNLGLLMSALGQKQTFIIVRSMSALPPKADIGPTTRSPRRAAAGSRSFVSCSCARTARHRLVPVGQMGKLGGYLFLRYANN